MRSLELDFSEIKDPRDIHVVFSNAFAFPGWYGHNWNAFWDLISSDYPLPDRLMLRGLDHLERVFPGEVEQMLSCFADYNSPIRICAVSVTNDYGTRMFFLSYEVKPTVDAARPAVDGAIVNCWVKADSANTANQIARDRIVEAGWEVVSHEEVGPVHVDLDKEDEDSFIRQACVDGAVFNFHSWSSEDDNGQ